MARAGDGAVVMKVQSPDIPHKTDAGAIALNVQGADAIAAAYTDITANAGAYAPNATIEGVSVDPMAAEGVDVIVGMTRDEAFGPMILVGLGGIHVEVFKDVRMSPAPVNGVEARRLLEQLLTAPG